MSNSLGRDRISDVHVRFNQKGMESLAGILELDLREFLEQPRETDEVRQFIFNWLRLHDVRSTAKLSVRVDHHFLPVDGAPMVNIKGVVGPEWSK